MSDEVLRPNSDDPNEWRAYWREIGMPWRTEKVITEDRIQILSGHRALRSNVEQGIFPFREIEPKLGRADIEWLLSTLGDEGPVDWSDLAQRSRDGLDLVGVDLRDVNLTFLPLARANLSLANLSGAELGWADLRGAMFSRSDLTKAVLVHTGLEGAHFYQATLTGARLDWVHAVGADFRFARLERAELRHADLRAANLSDAHLELANLEEANLEDAVVFTAHLEGADLFRADLTRARLNMAHFEKAILVECQLEGTILTGADLAAASFREANLEGANLRQCNLAGKRISQDDLTRIRQWKPDFPEALPPAELTGSFFGADTKMDVNTQLGNKEFGGVFVADVHWGDANLTVLDWGSVTQLGEEREARRLTWMRVYRPVLLLPLFATRNLRSAGGFRARFLHVREQMRSALDEVKLTKRVRLGKLLEAVRANRQLATVLRAQGNSEQGDQYAYRAQVLQRRVTRSQGVRKILPYIGSLILGAIAGYGYRPGRSILSYLVVILGFAFAYYDATHGLLSFGLPRTQVQALEWYEALVLSVSSFHGRGFFQPVSSLGDPVALLAAAEAVFGLLIEITFIATFTQRFFAR